MKKRRHLAIIIVWAALLAVAVIVFRDRIFPDGGDAAGTDAPDRSPPPAANPAIRSSAREECRF